MATVHLLNSHKTSLMHRRHGPDIQDPFLSLVAGSTMLRDNRIAQAEFVMHTG